MRIRVLQSLVVATVVVSGACSGGSDSASMPSSPSPATPAAITISITGINGAQSFNPNPASAGGQMVVFKNNDSVTHRVALNDGSIDTGNIAPGASSAAVMMPASGTNYHCTIHPSMIGSVSTTSGSSAPPCEGAYCSSAS